MRLYCNIRTKLTFLLDKKELINSYKKEKGVFYREK